MGMNERTTVTLARPTAEELALRKMGNESYDDVVNRLLDKTDGEGR